jgi:hypothetical protein
MLTSTVVYLPTGPRKAVFAAIRDAHYQMELRALRKRPGCWFGATWVACRCDPGVWRLVVEEHPLPIARHTPLFVGSKEDAQRVRDAKDGDIVEFDDFLD